MILGEDRSGSGACAFVIAITLITACARDKVVVSVGVGCLADQECDDADPRTTDRCGPEGRCVHDTRPLGREGPRNHPSCTNGLDDDGDGAIDLADPLCAFEVAPDNADAWQWQNPLWRDTLWGLWVSPAGNIYAVGGAQGTILRWDGARWHIDRAMAQGHLFTVWGLGDDAVWAGGEQGAMWRWDGTSWTPEDMEASHAIQGIWGTSPDALWAVEAPAILRRRAGAHWDTVAVPGTEVAIFQNVHGSAPDNVWIGGSGAWHFDGTRWRDRSDGLTEGIVEIVAFAPDDVWAAHPEGASHWNGETWSHVPELASTPLHGVWGLAPDDLWLFHGSGMFTHWDGTSWTDRSLSMRCLPNALHGRSADAVWAAGVDGTLCYWDGSSWTVTSRVEVYNLNDVFASAPDRVWADFGAILEWNGRTWSAVPSANKALAIWAADAEDAWAVGFDGVVQRRVDGHWIDIPSGTTATLRAVSGCAADDVWIAGDGTSEGDPILHWDGQGIERFENPSGHGLMAVCCRTSSLAYAAGLSGAGLRWDGLAWQAFDMPPAPGIAQLWCGADDEPWAVGNDDTLWEHVPGTGWRQEILDLSHPVALWGPDAEHLFVTGVFGEVRRRVDGAWVSFDTPFDLMLSGIHGVVEGGQLHLWVVGADHAILYRQTPLDP